LRLRDMTQFKAYDEKAVWFGGKRPNHGAAIRLFCFPYAGIGISAFRGWSLQAADICPVQFPGRESRHGEAPFRRMADLAAATLDAIAPFTDVPFALLGHSLGGAVAFEVARRLPPAAPLQRLFISARRAPHVPDRQPPISHLPADAFVSAVQDRYEGIPAAVLECPDLLELLLPRLRADLELLETYEFSAGTPIAAPISVFGGSRDPGIVPADLDGWRQHTAGDVRIRMIDAPHLFLQSQRGAILTAVAADLGLTCAVGAGA
jgi:medium-chain acyl-[acyl-carrier-protein] hydrolase